MFQNGTMSIQDYINIVGVAAIFISGANFVVISIVKTFWKLTFEEKKQSDIEKFKDLNKKIDELEETTKKDQKENEAFRHKYKSSVENIYELIKIRFDDWDKSLDNFKSLVETKIDLAISQNENKKKK